MKRAPVCDRPECDNEVDDPGPPSGLQRLGLTLRHRAPGSYRTPRHVHIDLCEDCRAEVHELLGIPMRRFDTLGLPAELPETKEFVPCGQGVCCMEDGHEGDCQQ